MEAVLAGLRGGMAGLAAQMVMQAALKQPHAGAALKANVERYARVRLGVSKVLAKVPAISCVGGGGGGGGGEGGGRLSRRARAGSGGSAGSDASAAEAGHAGLFLAVDVSALGLSAKEVSLSLRFSLRLSLLCVSVCLY